MTSFEIKFDMNTIDEAAKSLLQQVSSKTILFYGDMGVGKTTFISALVKALGGHTKASSPTFSIVNEYLTENDIVYHFDFYRINDISEAFDIGIEDYLCSGHWNFIEWPEKIDAILPDPREVLQLKCDENGLRSLKLN